MLDLVVCADTVHSMSAAEAAGSESPIGAVGIRDGRIAVTGSRADAADWASQRTLDLGDATLTPGLTDAHIHPIMGAAMMTGVDFTAATTLDGALAMLAESVAGLGRDEWALGWGIDPSLFGTAQIRGDVFDGVTRGLPMLLRLADGHGAIANQRALELSGITGPRRFDQGASIECDEQGRPTGLLLEFGAMEIVQEHMPEEAPERIAERFLAVLSGMSAAGLTGGHAMDFFGTPVDMLHAIEAETELPLRLRFSPWCDPGATEHDLLELLRLQGEHGRRWSVEGVKLFIDGTIDNGTAWLAQPDTLGQSRVSFWPDPASYRTALSWLDSRGVPTATHAIGDGGLEYVLQSMRALGGTVRHRIEHIETAPPELIRGLTELGVSASMQPTHCTHFTRADGADNWSRRLGPERSARGWPTRDVRDSGATLAIGSDWPVAPFDPREIMADAQLRRRAGRPSVAPTQPEQSLTARMALEGYTSHAAAAVSRSATSGSIELGRDADLTVFGADPLSLGPDELAQVPIVATLVGGTVQYRGAGFPGAGA